MTPAQKRRFANLMVDGVRYYDRLRPLCQRLADRAYVERPHWTQLDGDDYAKGQAKVLRRVWLGPVRLMVWITVTVDLVDGTDQAYSLEDLMPESEARYAFYEKLLRRTAFVRPKLPA